MHSNRISIQAGMMVYLQHRLHMSYSNIARNESGDFIFSKNRIMFGASANQICKDYCRNF